jgi:hypothetical protein
LELEQGINIVNWRVLELLRHPQESEQAGNLLFLASIHILFSEFKK